ncbi:hypothetical protein PRZ48_013714 [Zasmidium cellare]|uniref:DUF7702 domain-containing protein n=1 Tax=Zasmidium cellare TaxID=395010 RepID=A0ABR0E2C7_ZASCE|nr:hypothetical protein PRZ48_013714 [Zasmidium cellare]
MASKLHEQYDLAIFQLAVYILITPFTLYVFGNACTTKRTWYAVGWFYLLGFMGLLLAASGLTIGAGRNNINPTGLILQSVGLSPLFIVVESVIREAAVKTRKSSRTFLFSNLGVITLHLVVGAPAVLVGVGASKFFTNSNLSEAQNGLKLAKAGAVLFMVPGLWLMIMVAMACVEWRDTNKKLLIASIVSLFLLFLRILYAILEFFDTASTMFSPINGNIAARVIMQVLPQLFAAGILTFAGVLSAFATRELGHLAEDSKIAKSVQWCKLRVVFDTRRQDRLTIMKALLNMPSLCQERDPVETIPDSRAVCWSPDVVHAVAG